MKTIFRFCVLVLLVVGWGLAALSLHVVHTPGEMPVTIVTKEKLGIHDIYVDTRQWTLDDISRHPAVVARLIESGHAEALKHVVDPEGGDVARQLDAALGRHTDAPKSDGSIERMARRAGFRWPWENR